MGQGATTNADNNTIQTLALACVGGCPWVGVFWLVLRPLLGAFWASCPLLDPLGLSFVPLVLSFARRRSMTATLRPARVLPRRHQ